MIEIMLISTIVIRVMLLWIPALTAGVIIVRRKHEHRAFRALGLLLIIGALVNIMYYALALIMAFPGQGTGES